MANDLIRLKMISRICWCASISTIHLLILYIHTRKARQNNIEFEIIPAPAYWLSSARSKCIHADRSKGILLLPNTMFGEGWKEVVAMDRRGLCCVTRCADIESMRGEDIPRWIWGWPWRLMHGSSLFVEISFAHSPPFNQMITFSGKRGAGFGTWV